MHKLFFYCLLIASFCANGAEPRPSTPLPESQSDTAPVTQSSQHSYQHKIDQYSANYGPFSPQLAEMYLELGQSLRYSGDHIGANKAFTQALQINRVNHGLYSFHQEATLRALIDNGARIEDEEIKLDHYNKQLEQLYSHLSNSDFSVELVPRLIDSSNWYLEKYTQFQSRGFEQNLRQSIKLCEMAQNAIIRHQNKDQLQLIEPLQNIAESNYYLTRHYQYPSSPYSTNAKALYKSLQEQSFQHGLKAYRRIIALHKHHHSTPYNLAKAQIALGDYLQLFQKQPESQTAYINAWKTLNSAGDTKSIARLFDRPVILPEFHSPAPIPPKAVAEIKADIDHNGKAYNIEILQTYPANNAHVAKVAEITVQAAIFRSSITDGEIVNGQITFSLPLN